jgi:hypothetical protein
MPGVHKYIIIFRESDSSGLLMSNSILWFRQNISLQIMLCTRVRKINMNCSVLFN